MTGHESPTFADAVDTEAARLFKMARDAGNKTQREEHLRQHNEIAKFADMLSEMDPTSIILFTNLIWPVTEDEGNSESTRKKHRLTGKEKLGITPGEDFAVKVLFTQGLRHYAETSLEETDYSTNRRRDILINGKMLAMARRVNSALQELSSNRNSLLMGQKNLVEFIRQTLQNPLVTIDEIIEVARVKLESEGGLVELETDETPKSDPDSKEEDISTAYTHAERYLLATCIEELTALESHHFSINILQDDHDRIRKIKRELLQNYPGLNVLALGARGTLYGKLESDDSIKQARENTQDPDEKYLLSIIKGLKAWLISEFRKSVILRDRQSLT